MPRGTGTASLALALAGCVTVGPDYVEPKLAAPAAWQRIDPSAVTSTAATLTDLTRWWAFLDDPLLSTLIEQALVANTDVRTAQARLREARARRALAQADLAPTVRGSASAARNNGSAETGSGATFEIYQAGLDANWEADIFGGRRRAIEAAQADVESSASILQGTRVSLAAEVALNYIDIRQFQALLEVARRNLETQTETWQLTDWRTQAGLSSALELEQARTALEQTRAQIPLLESQLAQAQDRMTTLLATTPGTLPPALIEAGPLPSARDRVAVGIPADVLRQRPDVRAAERRLAAETARIGEIAATRYPDFTLSGSIGLEALSFSALGNSAALASSLLAGVSGVLFDGGRIRSRVEAQESLRDQALIAYEAAVIAALQEVESALAVLRHSHTRQQVLRDAVEAARNAALYALQRYRSGIVDFQAVLDTQRTVLLVEETYTAAQANNVSSLIRLYKALGGGWTPTGMQNTPSPAGETS
ncbi:MAG: efflux transporter outer membrane subunit [Betaproteobacteria bacterium]|nr:MAG: efflux transporter outer membrane subunit [Betaproteobacteria bacterium]